MEWVGDEEEMWLENVFWSFGKKSYILYSKKTGCLDYFNCGVIIFYINYINLKKIIYFLLFLNFSLHFLFRNLLALINARIIKNSIKVRLKKIK